MSGTASKKQQPGIPEAGEQRYKKYQQLDPGPRLIVQLLAVNVHVCGIRKVASAMDGLEINGLVVDHVSQKQMSSMVASLVRNKLISKTNKGITCDPLLRPYVTLELLKDKRYTHLVERMRQLDPVPEQHGQFYYRGYDQALRELQYLCYTRVSSETLLGGIYTMRQFIHRDETDTLIYEDVMPCHLAKAYAQQFYPPITFFILAQILELDLTAFDKEKLPYYRVLIDVFPESRELPLAFELFIHLLLFRSDCEHAERVVADNTWQDDTYKPATQGWIAFLRGENDLALEHFDAAVQLYKKKNRKRKASLPGYFGVFHVLALIKQGDEGALQEALDHIKRLERQKDDKASLLVIWKILVSRQLGESIDLIQMLADPLHDLTFSFHIMPVPFLLTYYPLIWLDPSVLDEEVVAVLQEIVRFGRMAGYWWLTALAAEILVAIYRHSASHSRAGKKKKSFESKAAHYEKIAREIHSRCNTASLNQLIRPVPEHEAALKTLIRLATAEKDKGVAGSDQRLVWWFSLDEESQDVELQPRLQKLSKNGKWTKGRAVALKKLVEEPDRHPLTEQDRAVCAAIEKEVESYGWGYRQHSYYEIDTDRAMLALVGHPLVFEHGTNVPVQIVRGEPALRISRKGKNIILELNPQPPSWKETLVVRESATRYVVYSFTRQQRKIAMVLDDGLAVPAEAEPLARKAADALATNLTVQSEIGGGTAAREVEADARPHVLLVPWNQGLQAEMVVRPLGQEGPCFPPGRGSVTVLAEIDGQRLQTSRDLQQEGKLAKEVTRACPVLSMYDSGTFQWHIEDPEECLELLVQLKEQEQVAVEWPQGEAFKIRASAGFDQMSLKMSKGAGDWFRASASLAVDDSLVMDLRQLLDRLTDQQGRFIRLDDGSFLALTQEFRKRLDDLRAYATPSGKGMKINPLASLALDDFFTEVGELKGDKAWKKHLRRFEPPEIPPVPSTLQAELRPYQLEGYRWLVTLAQWGVGACLADDMGLGKTVQALAALLTMADKGPILVVAPLSVVANWQEEAMRFAPSFNVLRFGPGDRREMLDNLQPFDLVVCSYGLLPKEAELLQSVPWQAVVLDEAQAIKNRNTKRSRAARGLNANFRLITTGTPVENHLGELWTLFEFLNPGLLGSFKQFSEKFGNIGSESGDQESRDRLRRLIRPFILRRLKSEVLAELPPRTEITMRIAMSDEEKALYEAMRQNALQELESEEGGAGHLQILAHIMKLRRVCCNPALVLNKGEASIPSSKLKVFGDIVHELIENRHKALVFSQFVGHLALIREFLDREGISYQYLDGQTTAAQRKKRIAAFQKGEGDVFLISLKAGGSGLNLTAADYVIHMDPWWNPAVEDQASDRAHRIGQQRPVTVYRLVMEGTIEEQIVELHARKRDLANSLLEGADVSGRMSAEELLALLRDAR